MQLVGTAICIVVLGVGGGICLKLSVRESMVIEIAFDGEISADGAGLVAEGECLFMGQNRTIPTFGTMESTACSLLCTHWMTDTLCIQWTENMDRERKRESTTKSTFTVRETMYLNEVPVALCNVQRQISRALVPFRLPSDGISL